MPRLRAEITAQDVLDGLYAEATYKGAGTSHAARVSAWVALGKYHSLFVDRTEVMVTSRLADLSDEELMEEIRRTLAGGEPPDLVN